VSLHLSILSNTVVCTNVLLMAAIVTSVENKGGSAHQKGVMDTILQSQPTWINYVRVGLDVVMAIILIFVVSGQVNNGDPNTLTTTHGAPGLHVHEMPIYLKSSVALGDMWSDADKPKEAPEADKLAAFKSKVATACTDIHNHPMCLCISGSSTRIDAKNCLLRMPHPSITSDWNIGSVSSAMILWFVASLATSVGTLPFINSYIDFVGTETQQSTIVTWNKFIVMA
jgi:hypothetical protein